MRRITYVFPALTSILFVSTSTQFVLALNPQEEALLQRQAAIKGIEARKAEEALAVQKQAELNAIATQKAAERQAEMNAIAARNAAVINAQRQAEFNALAGNRALIHAEEKQAVMNQFAVDNAIVHENQQLAMKEHILKKEEAEKLEAERHAGFMQAEEAKAKAKAEELFFHHHE
jgi:hypothetical protein